MTFLRRRCKFLQRIASFQTFLARDVIYTSRAYATMSVSVCPSVCDGSALWSRCMPGTQRLRQPAKLKSSYDPEQAWPPPMEGSSRAMLATSRPSCLHQIRCRRYRRRLCRIRRRAALYVSGLRSEKNNRRVGCVKGDSRYYYLVFRHPTCLESYRS